MFFLPFDKSKVFSLPTFKVRINSFAFFDCLNSKNANRTNELINQNLLLFLFVQFWVWNKFLQSNAKFDTKQHTLNLFQKKQQNEKIRKSKTFFLFCSLFFSSKSKHKENQKSLSCNLKRKKATNKKNCYKKSHFLNCAKLKKPNKWVSSFQLCAYKKIKAKLQSCKTRKF